MLGSVRWHSFIVVKSIGVTTGKMMWNDGATRKLLDVLSRHHPALVSFNTTKHSAWQVSSVLDSKESWWCIVSQAIKILMNTSEAPFNISLRTFHRFSYILLLGCLCRRCPRRWTRLGMRQTETSVDVNGRIYGMASTTTTPEPKSLGLFLSGLTSYKFGTLSTLQKVHQQVIPWVCMWNIHKLLHW